ncbi:MAG: glucans biosynthesis glucosyltransferase MdoH [bacterium]|nr:glucans biosynthesis glucosyltransferase MdoH [bacterium]
MNKDYAELQTDMSPTKQQKRNYSGYLRTGVFWSLVITSSIWMARDISYILQSVDTVWLRPIMFVIFVSCFTWICVPFWIAVAGFFVNLLRINPLILERHLPLQPPATQVSQKHAVIMPIYAEPAPLVFGAMAAMYDALYNHPSNEGGQFDFYLLSDTRNPDIALEEASFCQVLRKEGRENLFYRHREKNTARKAGNIEDFVKRWGARYESMLILDADSIMSADDILQLALLMEGNPQAALLQTSPRVVFAKTLFARLIQFTSRLYGQLFSYGASFWHGASSNYWGHNAIIRVEAFRQNCGLGELPGNPPFGGQILSHDFVEAALLRSAGWGVYLIPWLEDSYEQIPPTPLDFLQRDKRWSQGNLQHLKLLFRPQLLISSRTFFVLGAMAYLSSPLWLLLLLCSTLSTVLEAMREHVYFPDKYQLFPSWPISREEDAFILFGATALVLFGAKFGALFLRLTDKKQRILFGRPIKLISSAVAETIFFTLLAPTMMLYHTWFVANTFLGRIVSWNTQQRDTDYMSFSLALRSAGWISLVALAWSLLLYVMSPSELLWMGPILLGMLTSPLLIWVVSDSSLGTKARHYGLFLVPEETSPHPILLQVQTSEERLKNLTFPVSHCPDYIPTEKYQEMSAHPLFRWV